MTCEGDLADRYQSQGWVTADQPATEAASEKPQAEDSADIDFTEEKPVRRRQVRRR